jgi:uncharacterized membrane protein
VILGLAIFFCSIILPLINSSSIRGLRFEIKKLNQIIEEKDEAIRVLIKQNFSEASLKTNTQVKNEKQKPATEPIAEKEDKTSISIKETLKKNEAAHGTADEKKKQQPIAAAKSISTEKAVQSVTNNSINKSTASPPPQKPVKKNADEGFEKQLSARFMVWIGAVALAFAGYFLVKYSIEKRLLSPTVRVIMGLILGAGLLYGANWVRLRPAMANGTRIAQALASAAIAVLYVAVFAATSLYHLVPTLVGYVGMSAVTIIATLISLLYGWPIALFALIGGYATPILLSTGGGTSPPLFSYLFAVFIGILVTARYRNWWYLALLSLGCAFGWIILWLNSHSFIQFDSVTIGLFLLGITLSIYLLTKESFAEITNKQNSFFTFNYNPIVLLNYCGLGLAYLVMGLTVLRADFHLIAWLMFATLSVSGIYFTYIKENPYQLLQWISAIVCAFLLWAAQTINIIEYAWYLTLFAALYITTGYFFMWRVALPYIPVTLASITAIGFYVIGYFKIRGMGLVDDISLFWGILAFALAGLSIIFLQRIIKVAPEGDAKENVLSILAITATAFISTGMTVELEYNFLPVALTIQMLAMSWINTKLPIRLMREMAYVLAIAFGILMLNPLTHLFSAYGYTYNSGHSYILDAPLFYLGIPALMFFATTFFLKVEKDDWLVQIFEGVAIALFSMTIYIIVRKFFHPDLKFILEASTFTERGILTNLAFIAGLLLILSGQRYERQTYLSSGHILCAFGIARIVFLDFMVLNPWLNNIEVSGWIIVNMLILPFGLPIIWSYLWLIFIRTTRSRFTNIEFVPLYSILILGFTWVSMNVRFTFHPNFMSIGVTTNAEIYTYSAAWLLLGIIILFIGVLKKSSIFRYASLAVLLLAIAKVFLYDAANLEGLYRVAAFLGLGLSLIGISWFYTHFVFNDKVIKKKDT